MVLRRLNIAYSQLSGSLKPCHAGHFMDMMVLNNAEAQITSGACALVLLEALYHV